MHSFQPSTVSLLKGQVLIFQQCQSSISLLGQHDGSLIYCTMFQQLVNMPRLRGPGQVGFQYSDLLRQTDEAHALHSVAENKVKHFSMCLSADQLTFTVTRTTIPNATVFIIWICWSTLMLFKTAGFLASFCYIEVIPRPLGQKEGCIIFLEICQCYVSLPTIIVPCCCHICLLRISTKYISKTTNIMFSLLQSTLNRGLNLM